MSEPFLGEIKMTSFAFAPRGWALCNGQLLPINQNQALFALLGTQYGGNGQTTFALPDLRGRAPVHRGTVAQGEGAGAESVTLNAAQLPAHAHTLFGSANQATASAPAAANVLAQKARGGANLYGPTPNTTLAPVSLQTATGGNGPHDNMQPFLTISFVIALQGIFPSRN